MIVKDPADKVDYAFRFGPLLADGETLSAQTVDVPAGLTLAVGKPAPAIVGTDVVIWLQGGELDARYEGENGVVCHVTTSAGREYDLTLPIWMLNR